MRKLLTAATFALLGPSAVSAQTTPTPSLTMVVAFPAGGADDALGRLLASKMSELLARPVNVENTGGRGGMVGAQRVAAGKPDGSIFLLGSSATHALSQALYKTPLYDSEQDFMLEGSRNFPLMRVPTKFNTARPERGRRHTSPVQG